MEFSEKTTDRNGVKELFKSIKNGKSFDNVHTLSEKYVDYLIKNGWRYRIFLFGDDGTILYSAESDLEKAAQACNILHGLIRDNDDLTFDEVMDSVKETVRNMLEVDAPKKVVRE